MRSVSSSAALVLLAGLGSAQAPAERQALLAGPSVSGRLLDARGEPLRDTRLRLEVHAIPPPGGWTKHVQVGPSDAVFLSSVRVDTDADGRFAVTLPAPYEPGGRPWLLFAHSRRLDRWSRAVESLDAWPEDEVAVGDVRLRPTPVLAAGHVVDERGIGIPGVRTQVWASRRIPFLGSSTDAHGRFELCGELPQSALGLEVTKKDFLRANVHLIAGFGNHEIVLVLGGVIEGRVLLPAGVTADELLLRGKPLDRDDGIGSFTGSPAADGTFRFADLSPGRWRLTVAEAMDEDDVRWRFPRDPPPANAMRELDVEAGRTTLVELPAWDHELSILRVLTEYGRPVAAGWYALPEDAPGEAARRPFTRGEIRVAPAPARLVVGAPGRVTTVFEAPFDGVLTLPFGRPVTVRVPALDPPLPEGWRFHLAFARPDAGRTAPLSALWSTAVDARGRAHWRAPENGSWIVWWIVARADENQELSRAVYDPATTLELPDGPSLVDVELAPSEEAGALLAEILREIR